MIKRVFIDVNKEFLKYLFVKLKSMHLKALKILGFVQFFVQSCIIYEKKVFFWQLAFANIFAVLMEKVPKKGDAGWRHAASCAGASARRQTAAGTFQVTHSARKRGCRIWTKCGSFFWLKSSAYKGYGRGCLCCIGRVWALGVRLIRGSGQSLESEAWVWETARLDLRPTSGPE